MDKAQAIELRIKDIEMEKLKAERELLEIEQALDKIETEILKDLQRNF